MRFRHFYLLSEEAPGGSPLGAPGGGGPANMPPGPMGGGMGGGMGSPMGGGPMGGMGPPMGGGSGTLPPPVVPTHGDVWDVLDAILNHKPLQHEQQRQPKQNQNMGPETGTNNPPGNSPFGGANGAPGAMPPPASMGPPGAPTSGPMNSPLLQ